MYDYGLKLANSTFCEGRCEHKTTISYFFYFLAYTQPSKIRLQNLTFERHGTTAIYIFLVYTKTVDSVFLAL